MATQVVVFSVLLFGTSGVVIDFGRVYSEHSRMQAFTDQAALAAAAELDGASDAIERAVDSVFAGGLAPKAAAFSEGDGAEFGISHLFFLSDLSDDSGAQYNLAADIGGPDLLHTAFANGGSSGMEDAAASASARFVVAVAEERSVRNSLMRLINSAGSDTVRETNVVRTVAAATRKRLACGALSNLVVCNPWEGTEGGSFEEATRDPANVGIQFRHVADGQMDLDGALTRPNSLARRLALNGPAAVRAICSDPLTLPGADPAMTAEEAATAFAICMMASAREEEFCIGEDVAFVAASPEEVTTALGTAFDMWDEPISGVLDWDLDAEGEHSQLVDSDGNSLFNPGTAHPLRDESILFQPDLDILKGRIWDEPTAIANAAFGIPASSRLNHPKIAQYDDYNLRLNPCFRSGLASNCLDDGTGEIFDYVAQPTTYSNVANFYTSYFPNRFFRDFELPPFETTTFYDAYLLEREDWLHSRDTYTLPTGITVLAGQSLAEAGEDGSLDTHLGAPDEFVAQIQTRRAYDADGNPIDVNEDGLVNALDVEPAYSNFTYNPPLSPIDRSLERRVMNATVVNCGAAQVGDDGVARAPVVGFAELFLLQPPVPACADGSENCLNRDLVSSTIYSEFIGQSEMTETVYAVLVR
ncbi:MAG: pilus assembly protein TadG-related protein [Pikeienuella sp.]|uniref:pilus assembly protein TadG-related protein n=1 Tax=Pikeienuella sp. TaxID=2831957 RepID=UPI00391BAF38